MKLVLFSVGVVLMALMALLVHGVAFAADAPGVRIALVQAAGSDLKFERIDIENTGEQPADLTGWKLLYKTAGGGSPPVTLVDFTAPANWHVLLSASERETFLSQEIIEASPLDSPLRSAEKFAGGLYHIGGSVQLLDASGGVVDMVGWGTAAESVRLGAAAPAMTATTWLVRQGQSGNNALDYILETQNSSLWPPAIGSLIEAQDVCTNLEGLQREVPEMYHLIGAECYPIDACYNLEGVQLDVPEGMEYGGVGECLPIDLCLNLEGTQAALPEGYESFGERQCDVIIPAHKLLITELLPNPSGGDAGNEFIEFYNADIEPILLRNYRLVVGDKAYSLPDQTIMPGQYVTVSDADLGGSLPNTTGLPIWLLTLRGIEVDQVPVYMNARDDVSWAMVDGKWQYTHEVTPGEENVLLASLPCQLGYMRDEVTNRCRKIETANEAIPGPCREGQYRSEETGRCRNLAVALSLAPCKEGQYRSEETNRCRSFATLAASTLKPCADDQFRNPLTNRCKRIASSEDVALADCGEGRERNPVTNRCRNVVSAVTPTAAFPVEPVKDTAAAFAGWWALGGAGVLALVYAGWEWRREVAALIGRIRMVFSGKQ